MNQQQLKRMANQVRKGILDSVFHAKCGHPGGSLSSVELLTYLYGCEMNVSPQQVKDPNRDRFVLSKGHSAPVYYATLAQCGYFPMEELKTFRKIHARLQGHPEMKKIPGVDISTGSLGQGISAACGMALAAKLQHQDYRVYALLGDGELQEGQVWEAAMFAAQYQLDNLVVMIDNNGLQIDGAIIDIMSPYPIDEKFKSFGFEVCCVDAHDFKQLADAFLHARNTSKKPTVIVAKSIKGKGISFMENRAEWHGIAPNEQQYQQALKELYTIEKEWEA